MGKEFLGHRLPITEIEETAELMKVDDYMARFIAEYYQLKIRLRRLETLLRKITIAKAEGTKEPPHECPEEILRHQQRFMAEYLEALELRAITEGIELE